MYQSCHIRIKKEIISGETKKFVKKGVIIECNREKGDLFIIRNKKNGNMCIILSLKYLNKYVKYSHFKMESLADIFKTLQPNC